jgi:hypothetical protein
MNRQGQGQGTMRQAILDRGGNLGKGQGLTAGNEKRIIPEAAFPSGLIPQGAFTGS